MADNSLGYGFPEQCPDDRGPYKCDEHALNLRLVAENPKLDFPLSPDNVPPTPFVLDLLEFCAKYVGFPIEGSHHSYFDHYHLTWDRPKGLEVFVNEVNLMLQRNNVAFELSESGQARRLISKTLEQSFNEFIPLSGDDETDRLIFRAKELFVSPLLPDSRDGLEKLFDAFERLKTLEAGKDKKQRAISILAKSAPNQLMFHEMLSDEAMALSKIGNQFRIRHSETDQEPLESSHDVDYVFIRLFAFIQKVFSATDRVK